MGSLSTMAEWKVSRFELNSEAVGLFDRTFDSFDRSSCEKSRY